MVVVVVVVMIVVVVVVVGAVDVVGVVWSVILGGATVGVGLTDADRSGTVVGDGSPSNATCTSVVSDESTPLASTFEHAASNTLIPIAAAAILT